MTGFSVFPAGGIVRAATWANATKNQEDNRRMPLGSLGSIPFFVNATV